MPPGRAEPGISSCSATDSHIDRSRSDPSEHSPAHQVAPAHRPILGIPWRSVPSTEVPLQARSTPARTSCRLDLTALPTRRPTIAGRLPRGAAHPTEAGSIHPSGEPKRCPRAEPSPRSVRTQRMESIASSRSLPCSLPPKRPFRRRCEDRSTPGRCSADESGATAPVAGDCAACTTQHHRPFLSWVCSPSEVYTPPSAGLTFRRTARSRLRFSGAAGKPGHRGRTRLSGGGGTRSCCQARVTSLGFPTSKNS